MTGAGQAVNRAAAALLASTWHLLLVAAVVVLVLVSAHAVTICQHVLMLQFHAHTSSCSCAQAKCLATHQPGSRGGEMFTHL
jgi:hypothetical protein